MIETLKQILSGALFILTLYPLILMTGYGIMRMTDNIIKLIKGDNKC